MCGIAGALARRPEDAPRPGLAERMAAALVHRGPDGAGFFRAGPVALAHRRLAIIDLSEAGRQPMFNEDGQIAVVVNGEIYNHQELRADLQGKGHVFRSHSDSEVVVHLYEEVGARVPELLRGMFAFALWDARAGKLLLARDRFGEKPLYYSYRPDGLVFASEIAALLADEGTRATVSAQALDSYLALQYVPSPRTIFEEIHKLPAGHLLEVRCGQEPAPRRYYRASFAPVLAELDEEEAARRVRATVEEAVRLRLMSDVPLGAFLSGGIDSSIVVACMARASSQPVKTFSVGFTDGENQDGELPYARLIAERYRTEHHELVVDPDMVSLLPSIVRHHGEPFADTSAVPTRYLCEMTRQHVTVALSGDAGDEAFGGYRRYVWSHVADLLRRLPRPLLRAVAGALGAVPGGRARWLREYGDRLQSGEAERYLRFICHFSADEKSALYTPALRARFAADATAAVFAAELAASAAQDTVSRLCDLDVETYLPDDILTKVDVASMTHGLEARAPFCDHHVVELGAGLPGALKLRRGKGKYILKRAFADLVPDEILHRKKRGFALPTDKWFRGRLYGQTRELLLSQKAQQRGLFEPDAVAALIERHRRGEDHGERLWNLLVLEIWHRELVDGRAAFMREVTEKADQLNRAAGADVSGAPMPVRATHPGAGPP
ncbi:MAG TPA: asparagine synthase (glutamine-hydrolyzing) [Polyangia bacterium]|jgi:asparagine synthase (glutamine-hydrolysing)|nr:asparagine synthase (glutamine-hydrolyzing) [Polyangia bacterium]